MNNLNIAGVNELGYTKTANNLNSAWEGRKDYIFSVIQTTRPKVRMTFNCFTRF